MKNIRSVVSEISWLVSYIMDEWVSGFWLLHVIVKITLLLKCMITSYGTVIKQNGKYSFSSKFCCCRRSHTACFGEKNSSSSGLHKFPNVRSKHLLNFRIVKKWQSKKLNFITQLFIHILFVYNKLQINTNQYQVVHIKCTQFSLKECRPYTYKSLQYISW